MVKLSVQRVCLEITIRFQRSTHRMVSGEFTVCKKRHHCTRVSESSLA